MNYKKPQRTNERSDPRKRIIIGISGASGTILGIELLKLFRKLPEWETHLVMTQGAVKTMESETDYSLDDITSIADVVYAERDLAASISSGTFITAGMIVIPCSMKTAAGIAHGYSDNLLLRAADVTIKEQRKLVLCPREMPLSAIHLRNLTTLAELGVCIAPPMPAYYARPASIDDMNRHILGKILDKFGVEIEGFKRWEKKSSG